MSKNGKKLKLKQLLNHLVHNDKKREKLKLKIACTR